MTFPVRASRAMLHPMRSAFTPVAVILLFVSAGTGRTKDFDVQASPLLQGEHCYDHSPDEVIRELTQAG
jgi:hypothetical protein